MEHALDQNHVVRGAAAEELLLLRKLQKRRVQLRVGLNDGLHNVRRVGLLLDLLLIRPLWRDQRADEAIADEVDAIVASVACVSFPGRNLPSNRQKMLLFRP